MAKAPIKYSIIRDTREKSGEGWTFRAAGECEGTISECLTTGDYAVKGLEKYCVVERKATTAEVAGNLFTNVPRFEAELTRMKEIEHSFIVCCFPWSWVEQYPKNSGIPFKRWGQLRVTGRMFQKRITTLMMDYPHVHWIFADNKSDGQAFTRSLFKRVVERYGKKA